MPPTSDEIEDNGCIPCTPQLADKARTLATLRGHKDADELITCSNGAKVPVWQFYVIEAARPRS